MQSHDSCSCHVGYSSVEGCVVLQITLFRFLLIYALIDLRAEITLMYLYIGKRVFSKKCLLYSFVALQSFAK